MNWITRFKQRWLDREIRGLEEEIKRALEDRDSGYNRGYIYQLTQALSGARDKRDANGGPHAS